MKICTNKNCALNFQLGKVHSLKSSGEGCVGKCAYRYCNAFDAYLNEQVKRACSHAWHIFKTLVTCGCLPHRRNGAHFTNNKCHLSASHRLSEMWHNSKEPPAIIYLQCRDLFRLHDSVILHKQKGHVCGQTVCLDTFCVQNANMPSVPQ